MSGRLIDKIVVVTGASKGIGRALALGLAREGAHLLINYHSDATGAERVAEEIEELGRRAMAVRADISRVTDIHSMFETAQREFGRIDVLVNNAAITGWTSLFDTTEAKWDQVVDTNLKGTFFCSLEAARMMRETGGGSIVNVSTNCAALGVKNLVAYATSKAGIHGLTKQLAVELAPYSWGSMTPLGRTALPDEMVGPAVFLASDESSYMTGQVFYVDGGWTVQGRIPVENLDQALRRNEQA
jgi:glucose 1-dehydrogenase